MNKKIHLTIVEYNDFILMPSDKIKSLYEAVINENCKDGFIAPPSLFDRWCKNHGYFESSDFSGFFVVPFDVSNDYLANAISSGIRDCINIKIPDFLHLCDGQIIKEIEIFKEDGLYTIKLHREDTQENLGYYSILPNNVFKFFIKSMLDNKLFKNYEILSLCI